MDNNENVQGDKPVEIPSILVEKFLKKQFRLTFNEEQEKQEETFIKNLGDNMEYVNRLKGTPYNFTTEGLTYIDHVNEKNIAVSNALVVPIKKYDLKTEEETKSNIELKCFVAPEGEELPNIIIPIEQIERGNWFVNALWSLKIKFELPPQKSIQINCIKELSRYMDEEIIYKYTGFTEIEGKKVLLHNGGAIGIDKAVKVDLGDEVLNRYKLTNKGFEIADTLKITLQCLEVAPTKITLPILALIFMAPLTSIFEEVGTPVGFVTWILGPQQCKKTSMATAFSSHYGNFNKNQAPMSFLDSTPTAKEKASKLKDVVIVCDDYFPSTNRQEAADMKKFTETIISLYADGMSGTRSKSNGEMRKTNRAKGQIIATRRNVSRVKPKSYV